MRALLDDLPDDLRRRALTHPAFAATPAASFERLEFLGDSVLGLAITDAIYRRWPELPEGELTRVRAGAVSRDSCARVARDGSLGEAMVALADGLDVAHAPTVQRLAQQRNALAALAESVIGASFLAHGFEAVAPRILAAFEERLAWAFAHRIDARSRLQELAARTGAQVEFLEVEEAGPPHDRRFTIAASLDLAPRNAAGGPIDSAGEVLRADGTGRSKQEAQQAAAAALLARMDGESD